MSLPVWEEWIEIRVPKSTVESGKRLFPYGKSGLKLFCAKVSDKLEGVSSRMGRVD